jgi:hypothetical protein
MAENTYVEPTYWGDKLSGKLKLSVRGIGTSLKGWRQNNAKESLEAELAKIIETANGHKAKGKAAGNPVFAELEKKAFERIDKYCTKYGVTRAEVEAQAPALAELHALTISARPMSPGLKILGTLIGGGLFLTIIGMASGVISASHSWMVHILTHTPLH